MFEERKGVWETDPNGLLEVGVGLDPLSDSALLGYCH